MVTTHFIFKKQLDKIFGTKKFKFVFADGDAISDGLSKAKGLCVPRLSSVFINLESPIWKRIKDEDGLINEVSKTIIHECVHSLIKETSPEVALNSTEERIAQIMAGQLGITTEE